MVGPTCPDTRGAEVREEALYIPPPSESDRSSWKRIWPSKAGKGGSSSGPRKRSHLFKAGKVGWYSSGGKGTSRSAPYSIGRMDRYKGGASSSGGKGAGNHSGRGG